MGDYKDELKKRTRKFTIEIIRFVNSLPESRDVRYLGDQLYRSGASVGANYRAACRAKTNAILKHKLSIVEEEADECVFWLDIMMELKLADNTKMMELFKEANELTAIFTASNKSLSMRK